MSEIKLVDEVEAEYSLSEEQQATCFDIAGIPDGKINLTQITLFDVQRLKKYKKGEKEYDFLPMLIEKKKDLAESQASE
jgi:hypothetical protein